MAMMPSLSSVLPPLVLGTATFNTQYHPDPSRMPYREIVSRALSLGIAAFDTSPYYGPSETLLGDALTASGADRSTYFLATKAGRVAAETFDYSPAAIRASVRRSVDRLHASHLDLVYAHDVEFVSPEECLAAVTELRRLRDEEGLLRYVGISGYPVNVLASLAEMVLRETGEPLDAVLSYNHFCLQNTRLGSPALLRRFRDAGVECVLNAGILGMGLLTTRGVDDGPQAAWHPAPPELKAACRHLATMAEAEGEGLEGVCLRWSLDTWGRTGADLGTSAVPVKDEFSGFAQPFRMGVSVVGVTRLAELEEYWAVWKSVAGAGADDEEARRRRKIDGLVRDKMWPSLGSWKDYSWPSGLERRESFAPAEKEEAKTGHGPARL
jgi:aryl-alcohol dehydrogenase-like predicted oxidoreductase